MEMSVNQTNYKPLFCILSGEQHFPSRKLGEKAKGWKTFRAQKIKPIKANKETKINESESRERICVKDGEKSVRIEMKTKSIKQCLSEKLKAFEKK